MCLGLPMRVLKIDGDFAQVQAGGLLRRVNIQMLPKVRIGDYLMVHVGFAIEQIDPQKAQQTLRLIEQIP